MSKKHKQPRTLFSEALTIRASELAAVHGHQLTRKWTRRANGIMMAYCTLCGESAYMDPYGSQQERNPIIYGPTVADDCDFIWESTR